MPRKRSPSPYCPGPVLKNRRIPAATSSSASAFTRASASAAVIVHPFRLEGRLVADTLAVSARGPPGILSEAGGTTERRLSGGQQGLPRERLAATRGHPHERRQRHSDRPRPQRWQAVLVRRIAGRGRIRRDLSVVLHRQAATGEGTGPARRPCQR